jgi:N-acetylglucosamine-6-phosphate deacetylase
MAFALLAPRLFDGEAFREDHAVIVEDRLIREIVPRSAISGAVEIRKLDNGFIAPGFIDVQVNGGGGVLLNETPTAEGARRIAGAHRTFGTTGLLPTVITDAPEVMASAIAGVREARLGGAANILGLHIEGPFIDRARKGAHDERFIRSMTAEDVEQLAGARCGRLMLTLAPNCVDPGLVRDLVKRGILVSLGHAESGWQAAAAAVAAGATAFTHLFNAMSQMTGREPGMVGAALASQAAFCGLIADGHHVHDVSARIALAALGRDRIMLITDAMPPAAGGPDVFRLQGREVMRKNGRLELADGTLAGSNLTMDEAVRYCVRQLGVALEDALCMASLTPARFLKLDDRLGRIAPGYLASLVHLSDELKVRGTWVEGR